MFVIKFSVRFLLLNPLLPRLVLHRVALLAAAVMLYRKGAAIARLYSITVAPEARSQGIARALMAACEADAADRSARAVRLEVRSTNSSAIRLYEAGGYRVIATRESYYPDGEAALRMEKSLDAPSNGAP